MRNPPQVASDRVVIRPTYGWPSVNLRELYSYREIIVFLVWRDVKVRYRQTMLGALWVIIQPLLTMLMMAVVFGALVKIPSDGISYPVFCLTGLVLWGFFARAVTHASASVLDNAQLVEKVYFPRLAIPISAGLSGLVDFCISFVLLLIIMVATGYYPRPQAVLCLPILMVAVVFAAGVGSAFAGLSVRFRDVQHLMSYLVQLWFFATPVIYPVSLLPQRWQLFAAINPLFGLVDSFRWALLGSEHNPWSVLSVSFASAAFLAPAGLLVFRRLERTFADMI